MGKSWRSIAGPFGSGEVQRSRERTSSSREGQEGEAVFMVNFYPKLNSACTLGPDPRLLATSLQLPPASSLLRNTALVLDLHRLKENCPGSFSEAPMRAGVFLPPRENPSPPILQAQGPNPHPVPQLSLPGVGRLPPHPPSLYQRPDPRYTNSPFASGKSGPRVFLLQSILQTAA